MEAIEISGKESLTDNSKRYMDKVVIYMFTATWCGPCKNIKKVLFGEDSIIDMEKRDLIKILKIDIDDPQNSDLNDCFAIKSLPTFVINKTVYNKTKSINEFKKIIKFSGGDINVLVNNINKTLEDHTLFETNGPNNRK